MNTIKIGKRTIGDGHPCFIIAEAGINHDGDFKKAIQLIDASAECGVDAVKFQTHLAKHEMIQSDISADYVGEPIYDLIKRMEFSREQHIKLMTHAQKKGIIFLSTPFSREAADLLEEIGILAFKIGSGEMTNLPLLKHVARKGKPMIVSTGMSTVAEITETVNLLKKMNMDFALMQCTSTYPTAYEDIPLGFITKMKKEFYVPVGLSDHSAGIYIALGSIPYGTSLIEKHFTISREWPGPDQKASIEPDELMELVKGVRAIEKATGSNKKVHASEKQVQAFARESIVSLVDIPKGSIIQEDMVWVKRPGTGIPAKELDDIIGKTAKKDIKKDSLLDWNDIR